MGSLVNKAKKGLTILNSIERAQNWLGNDGSGEEPTSSGTRSNPVGGLRDSERAREAGRLSGEARRRRKEERAARLESLTRGPREVIAQTLHDNGELLARATLKALEDAASDDAGLRRSGRQALPRLLDQGLGRVEEATGAASEDDVSLMEIPREERMKMIAELRAEIAADEATAE